MPADGLVAERVASLTPSSVPVDRPDAQPELTLVATRVVAGTPDGRAEVPRVGCTAPQLRRFIKSRVYVPLHELRRRFGIDGLEDDVSPVDLDAGRIFVGLPAPEARLLQDLLRAGDIGYELSMDPRTPIVVGVYPMRPVARN